LISQENRKNIIKEAMASDNPQDKQINILRQAEILEVPRSSLYYQSRKIVKQAELELLNQVDEIYTDYPFYGSRRIKTELYDRFKKQVSRDYVRKLMKILNIETIYPKPKNTSQSRQDHYKYPYLLKNTVIIHPNQVWGTDITYIRLAGGFCYLAAIIDWYSRYVLAWKLSNSLDNEFCLETLTEALKTGIPGIHNSDQGVQYTSDDYIALLKNQNIKISMDSRGRCMDNIFTERLWRTVKYENVYLKAYSDIPEVKAGLTDYFQFYNHKRRHQSLPNNQTPAQIYFQ